MEAHPGLALRLAIAEEKPLQIPGVIYSFAARLAEEAGFRALYLSGAGVANAHFALPDLALTSINDVAEEVRRITAACSLPLLIDADTGWGSPLNVFRTFKLLSLAGGAGAHIEDQTEAKRCGHREGKQVVNTQHMQGRIKAALDGRVNDKFLVMARTDALAVEEEAATLERVLAYQAVGAEAIFLEAVTSLDQYQRFAKALNIPLLANMTEFGKTPILTTQQLAAVGVSMVLYPLSAFRAMNQVAQKVYSAIRTEGSQLSVISLMQDRQELYRYLRYEAFEQQLDQYLQLTEREHGR